MNQTTILVTGAGGHLGRRVLELLLERGAGAIIATTRKPEALADFAAKGVDVRRASFNDDEKALTAAFNGAGRALLISTDDLLSGKRVSHQVAAVRALADAGVEHVVYTSLAGAPASSISFAADHAETEGAISKTGLSFTLLRNNLYADILLYSLPAALASGQIVDARGAGRVAWVTREDCARVAAAALADASTGRHVLEVSGAEAISSEELAAIASEVFARPIRHTNTSTAALVNGMVQHGTPQALATVFASVDAAVAKGELASVTAVVRKLTGTAPQSLRDFLIAQKSKFLQV